MEGSLIGHIVNKEDSHCTTVVCRCDGAETFLARCVPNLEFHSLAVQLDCADLKINSDGGNEGGGEGVLAESQETA